MAETTERIYTLDAYRALPADDAFLYELKDGALVREPRPGRIHGSVIARILRRLVEYAEEHGGFVTTETGFILTEDPPTLRGPDAAYLREDPAPYGAEPDGFIRGAPDVAVEVVSPHDAASELAEKVDEYLNAGAREVWVVYPSSQRVRIETGDADPRLFRTGDIVVSHAMPGLELPVDEILHP